MRTRLIAPALLLSALVAQLPSAPALAGDLFGRTGYYDATGSEPVKSLRFNHAFINRQTDVMRDGRRLAGAATTEVRRNYVYIQDTDGTQTIPYRNETDLFNSFEFALRELYRMFPDQYIFVYLFTSFDTNVGAFFYAPEASNDRGIGQAPMDTNGASPREGFVFMNYWQSFQQIYGQGGQTLVQAQARSVFNQEAGHRWCCFIQAGAASNGAGADLLLGRDDSHWSYFMETGGSPMEGNHWTMSGNGRFTTATGFQNWHYSPLDLYLMGLIPPEEVPPFMVIQSPVVGAQQDLFGQALTKASPPQIIAPTTVTGTRVDIGIDAIVNRNGARMPPVGQAPTNFKVVFIMLASRTTGLNESQRVQFEALVDDYALGFTQATGNRASFDYELVATPKQPIGGSCQMREECDMLEASVCLTIPPVEPGTGLCTRPCSTESSCPQDWCCQTLETQVSVCLPQELCAPPPPPDAGISEIPDAGVADTGVVQGGACTCDKTYGCDRNDDDTGPCLCDAECREEKSSCTCLTANGESSGPAALFMAVLGLALVARRRRG